MAEALTYASAASAAADVDAGDRLYAALAALPGAATKQLQLAAERPVIDLADAVARRGGGGAGGPALRLRTLREDVAVLRGVVPACRCRPPRGPD